MFFVNETLTNQALGNKFPAALDTSSTAVTTPEPPQGGTDFPGTGEI